LFVLTKHLQQHKAQLVGQRVRAVITCVLCQKSRCVYAQNALSKILKDEIINLEEDGEYSCGGALVDEDHHMRHSVVVRRQLNCSSPMKTTYYSAHIHNIPIASSLHLLWRNVRQLAQRGRSHR
jgi:hypothetical protein